MNSFNEFILLIANVVLIWIFRKSIIMYPIKLFTVLLHEIGHALATLITGGRVIEIRVNRKCSGYTLVQGGNYPISFNAGYLGSLLFGFLIFYFTYTSYSEFILGVVGVLIVVIALLWVRNVFSIIFTLIIAGAFILFSVTAPKAVLEFVTRFVGMCVMLHSFLQINNHSEVMKYKRKTDATDLETITKFPAWAWVWFWRIVSVLVLGLVGRLIFTGQLG